MIRKIILLLSVLCVALVGVQAGENTRRRQHMVNEARNHIKRARLYARYNARAKMKLKEGKTASARKFSFKAMHLMPSNVTAKELFLTAGGKLTPDEIKVMEEQKTRDFARREKLVTDLIGDTYNSLTQTATPGMKQILADLNEMYPGNQQAVEIYERMQNQEKKAKALDDEALELKEKGMLIKASENLYYSMSLWSGNPRPRIMLEDIRHIVEYDYGKSDDAVKRFYAEGYLAYFNKEWDAAISSWEKLLNIAGSNKEITGYLNGAKARQKLARNRKDAKNLYAAAKSDVEGNHFIEAEEKLKEALSLDQNLTDAAALLTVVKDKSRQIKEAQQNRETGQKYENLMQKGIAAYQTGDYKKAELLLVNALKIRPENAEAKGYLQLVRTSSNDKHNPQQADESYRKGLILYADGRVEDAIVLWEKTLGFDPDHKKAKAGIKKAQMEMEAERRNK